MSLGAIRTITRREVGDTLSDWRILAPMFILAFLLPLILVRAASFAIRFIDDPNTVPLLVPFVMLLVGFINSITNPIDKKLVTMTDAFTQSCAFGAGMCVLFTLMLLARKADAGKVIRSVPFWAALAGTLEAVALIFQLSSHNYIDVVITISIKRAGIILIVLLGWLVFKEKNIGDKLIASSVMLVGVLIIYLPSKWVDLKMGLLIAALAVIGMFIAFYLTKDKKEAAVGAA